MGSRVGGSSARARRGFEDATQGAGGMDTACGDRILVQDDADGAGEGFPPVASFQHQRLALLLRLPFFPMIAVDSS